MRPFTKVVVQSRLLHQIETDRTVTSILFYWAHAHSADWIHLFLKFLLRTAPLSLLLQTGSILYCVLVFLQRRYFRGQSKKENCDTVNGADIDVGGGLSTLHEPFTQYEFEILTPVDIRKWYD